ncbi:MAG: 3-methylitaconate isomerase, partial [Deltaproteobacteria bacterium]|nr:3-methylitaconate isomerase [Deltaproteobacteria bacterium]
GLVEIEEPVTKVRIYQVNTKKLIVAEVPVKNGVYNEKGDFAIDGIPGTGGKITLHFHKPGGSVTKSLLPTGNPADEIDVPGLGKMTVSLVDATNPMVFVRARDLGLKGTEIAEIEAGDDIREKLEAIRSQSAVMI